MATIKWIANWSGRHDVIVMLADGREFPAVWLNSNGAFYFKDGLGRQRRADVTKRGDREWIVLDWKYHFKTWEDMIDYLEGLGGEPLPRGKVAIVGQVGGQFIYAHVPQDAGAGE